MNDGNPTVVPDAYRGRHVVIRDPGLLPDTAPHEGAGGILIIFFSRVIFLESF
jgi:hypothetical protein